MRFWCETALWGVFLLQGCSERNRVARTEESFRTNQKKTGLKNETAGHLETYPPINPGTKGHMQGRDSVTSGATKAVDPLTSVSSPVIAAETPEVIANIPQPPKVVIPLVSSEADAYARAPSQQICDSAGRRGVGYDYSSDWRVSAARSIDSLGRFPRCWTDWEVLGANNLLASGAFNANSALFLLTVGAELAPETIDPVKPAWYEGLDAYCVVYGESIVGKIRELQGSDEYRVRMPHNCDFAGVQCDIKTAPFAHFDRICPSLWGANPYLHREFLRHRVFRDMMKRDGFTKRNSDQKLDFQTSFIRIDVNRGDFSVDAFKAMLDAGLTKLGSQTRESLRPEIMIRLLNERAADGGGPRTEWFSDMVRTAFDINYGKFVKFPTEESNALIWGDGSTRIAEFKALGKLLALSIAHNAPVSAPLMEIYFQLLIEGELQNLSAEMIRPIFPNAVRDVLAAITSRDPGGFAYSTLSFEEVDGSVIEIVPGGDSQYVDSTNMEGYFPWLLRTLIFTPATTARVMAFMEGFYSVIPRALLAGLTAPQLAQMFTMDTDVDVDDLQAHAQYDPPALRESISVRWFFDALRELDPKQRSHVWKALTGLNAVPLGGIRTLSQQWKVNRGSIIAGTDVDMQPIQISTCERAAGIPAYTSLEVTRRQVSVLAERDLTMNTG